MSFSNPVVGGENGELIRQSIQSPNYVAGVSGWTINRDGSAEFNNVTIRLNLTSGSITVGPAGMPQVVIDSDASKGFIEFPTNDPLEENRAIIRGIINNGGFPFENLSLDLRSPSINTGAYSYIKLESENADASELQKITLGLNGLQSSLVITSDTIRSNGELYVNGIGVNGNNFVTRLSRGRTNGPSFITDIGSTDTAISNGGCFNTQLETGVAYKVSVQIRTLSTSGAQPGAEQGIYWKLWDGSVGGSQLGTTIQKFMESDGSNQSSQNFMFVFEHTGSTGSRTVNLSAQQFAGTNNVRAVTSNQYFILVERIGDPSNILNL